MLKSRPAPKLKAWSAVYRPCRGCKAVKRAWQAVVRGVKRAV
jgi:hypothetical protein